MPEIAAPTDTIVKVTRTTICGTDLHILKGDVPSCEPGRVLGHEGVGVVHQVSAADCTGRSYSKLTCDSRGAGQSAQSGHLGCATCVAVVAAAGSGQRPAVTPYRASNARTTFSRSAERASVIRRSPEASERGYSRATPDRESGTFAASSRPITPALLHREATCPAAVRRVQTG